ncbi:MAG: hypothetical protein ACWA5U_10630 [bacterium]
MLKIMSKIIGFLLLVSTVGLVSILTLLKPISNLFKPILNLFN